MNHIHSAKLPPYYHLTQENLASTLKYEYKNVENNRDKPNGLQYGTGIKHAVTQVWCSNLEPALGSQQDFITFLPDYKVYGVNLKPEDFTSEVEDPAPADKFRILRLSSFKQLEIFYDRYKSEWPVYTQNEYDYRKKLQDSLPTVSSEAVDGIVEDAHTAYIQVIRKHDLNSRFGFGIRWGEVAKHYAGIEIPIVDKMTSICHAEVRPEFYLQWLGNWQVGCGFLWNLKARKQPLLTRVPLIPAISPDGSQYGRVFFPSARVEYTPIPGMLIIPDMRSPGSWKLSSSKARQYVNEYSEVYPSLSGTYVDWELIASKYIGVFFTKQKIGFLFE